MGGEDVKRPSASSPLILCAFLFAVGIVLGALGLRVLSPDEKAELVSYLDVFMGSLRSPGIEPGVVFRLSLITNLKTALLMWGFGLAVIGVPLTFVMLLVKGFVVGFSSFFVLTELPTRGASVFLSGIFPHVIISIPAFVMLAAWSVSFSFALLRERPWAQGNLWRRAAGYTLRCTLAVAALILSSAVEAYITPHLLNRLGRF